jgi:hypothetical protein
MLHLPYTSMVLGFVVIGAVVAPSISWTVLFAALAAYFLALGIGAHFLDQLPGMGSRYVRHWPAPALWAVGVSGIAAGASIGVLGAVLLRSPGLLALVAVQGVCAVGYPLAPLFAGLLHRDSVFALSWGSLPFFTSYYAQSGQVSAFSLILAVVFAIVAVIEIRVSRRSRELRRNARNLVETTEVAPGATDTSFRTLDRVLQALSLGTTVVAVGLLAIRFLPGR